MPERITPEQLAEIEAYTDAATGPRLLVGHKSWAGENAVLTDEGHPVAVFGHGDVAKTDSEFFARARADVPKLIAEVKESHAETAAYATSYEDLLADLIQYVPDEQVAEMLDAAPTIVRWAAQAAAALERVRELDAGSAR